jgi:sortase (surface protein transpeptidase)
MKAVADNSANFRQSHPDVIPESLKRPAKNTVVPVTPVVEYQAPDLLSIPELGVTSTIVVSPLEGDRLVIPSSEYVGEYTESTPLIGTEGTTLLVGHVNFADGSPGALAPISSAKEGQLVKASDGTGKVHIYKVVDVSTYVKRALPEEVFATTGPRRLVLVTCGGPLVEVDGALAYSSNVVVTAVPVN